MTRRVLWVAACLVGAWSLLPRTASAQINLGALSGENTKGYLSPLPSALSGTMNSAIFQSGDVPRAGITIDVGIRLMSVGFSDDDRSFTADYPDGGGLSSVEAPTVIGDTSAVVAVAGDHTTHAFPGGFDIDNFAVAVPQISVGGFMGTRATLRYIALQLGDDSEDLGDVKLFGIGIQHSISQYLPGLPVDLALGGFYQSFDIGEDLLDTNGLHLDLTGSKSFGVLQPYAALGYDRFSMKAKYDIKDGDEVIEKIDVEFDDETNVHLTAGVLARLAVVKLHAEVNVAAETGFALGLSFGN